jgi:hypothetical protein
VGEWGVSLVPTLFTKKFSQILVQRCPHRGILDESAFLSWNVLLDLVP